MADESLKRLTVLYVEDEDEIRQSLLRFLQRRVDKVYTAKDGKEGLELYKEHKPNLVITDIQMPIMNGLAMAEEIKKINIDAPIIITTAFSDEEYFLKAIDIGIDKYVKKPIDNKLLLHNMTKIAHFIANEQELAEKKWFIETILDASPNFILITDGKEIFYLNKSIMDFFGVRTLEEFEEKNKTIDDFIVNKNSANEKKFGSWFETLDEEGEKVIYMTQEEGLKIDANAFMVRAKRISSSNPKRFLVIFTDITHFEKEKEKFKELSIKDPLTNIYNRNKFNEMLDAEIRRSQRFQNEFSLIMFDIDYFKTVNDTYGHQVGDYVLKKISSLVNDHIRTLDLFARYGGEEFIMLLPETSLRYAIGVAEKLRVIIESCEMDIVKNITCSFGVVEYIENEEKDKLIKRVDDMLYKAKNNGRNMVEY
ncbi:MAG: two-component system, cell cycle response regulator [Campylobacterota bacterium]|nr:two-component system, cell cycle response regulator [Campylobacterota bacterium]